MAGTYDQESWLGIWLARKRVVPLLADAKVLPNVDTQYDYDEPYPDDLPAGAVNDITY